MDTLTSFSLGIAKVCRWPDQCRPDSEDHYYRSHEPNGRGLTLRLIPLIAAFAVLAVSFQISSY